MTTPDRWAYLAAQEAWAVGKAYQPEPAKDTRTHEEEIRRPAHQGHHESRVPPPPAARAPARGRGGQYDRDHDDLVPEQHQPSILAATAAWRAAIRARHSGGVTRACS